MREITPNHLLNLFDIVGLKLVEEDDEYISGCITKQEIFDLAKREKYSEVRFLYEDSPMVTSDLLGYRMRIVVDKTGVILDIYLG